MKKRVHLKLRNYFLFTFFTVITFSSCSVEDLVSDDILGGGNITAKINGNAFESTAEYDKVEINIIAGVYVISITTGDAEGLSKLKGMVIVMSGEDFGTLETGKTWNDVGTDDQVNKASAAYAEDDGSNESNDFDTDITTAIYVKITAIDKSKKTISGEFSFTVVDEDTGKEYKATNGKFKEITYSLTEF